MGDSHMHGANRRLTGYGPIRLLCAVLGGFRTIVTSLLPLPAPAMIVFFVACFCVGFYGAPVAPVGPCVVHSEGCCPKRLRRSSEVVFRESTFPLKDPAQQVASQLDDEFALDLLVHGHRVGDAPVDLAQEHSRSDVSASPTSPSVSPSPRHGASSPSASASPSPSPGPRVRVPPQRLELACVSAKNRATCEGCLTRCIQRMELAW